jgi:hypothetical protein
MSSITGGGGGTAAPAAPPPAAAFQPPLQAQNSGPVLVPQLAPDRVTDYARLFEKAGAQNGLLSGSWAGMISR